ncbi:MAG: hypothetical protein AAF629_28520 [Chloroflexota bacterium]
MAKTSNHFRNQIRRSDWLVFVAVLAVAIFFRFYRLGSFPLGLPNDAAVNGLDAWRLLNRDGYPLFLDGNGGREALFMYLQASAIALFGTTPLAVRLPGAIIDTLTVSLIYWFARWWFAQLPQQSDLKANKQTLFDGEERLILSLHWGALWVGFLAASSYWLVSISRLGFRAVLVPLFAVLFLWCFLLGWHHKQYRWFCWAGLFLGLQAYAYPAGRILPFALLLTLILELIGWFWTGRNRADDNANPRVLGSLISLALAGVLYLPMMLYTQTAAGQPANRVSSVAIWSFADSPEALLAAFIDNVKVTASFFCCQGNTELVLFGLPGRPSQYIVLGIFLFVGLGWSFVYFRRFDFRFLCIWFFAAWFPSLLTIEAPHPLRLIAAAPPMIMLTGYGLWHLFRQRKRAVALGVVWLCISMIVSYNDYFNRWPQSENFDQVFKRHLVDQYQQIAMKVDSGETVYISRDAYVQPPLHYYLTASHPPLPTAQFQETELGISFWDKANTPAWIRLSVGQSRILPALSQASQQYVREIRDLDLVNGDLLHWNDPVQLNGVEIGPTSLVGFSTTAMITPGESLDVTLFWQALAPIGTEYDLLVHVVDDRRQGWGADTLKKQSSDIYPSTYWRPGQDVVPDYHQIQLPNDMPIGRYQLAVSVFDPVQNSRLPVINPKVDSPDTVFVGRLKVPLVQEAQTPMVMVEANFADQIDLIGYSLETAELSRGQPLMLDLFWRSQQTIEQDLTVFVHLLDQTGTWIAGQDSPPLRGAYPTGIWDADEEIFDPRRMDTGQIPNGEYQIAVGLYDPLTGARLAVNGEAQGQIILPQLVEIIE